jgi:hypothetical protein
MNKIKITIIALAVPSILFFANIGILTWMDHNLNGNWTWDKLECSWMLWLLYAIIVSAFEWVFLSKVNKD